MLKSLIIYSLLMFTSASILYAENDYDSNNAEKPVTSRDIKKEAAAIMSMPQVKQTLRQLIMRMMNVAPAHVTTVPA